MVNISKRNMLLILAVTAVVCFCLPQLRFAVAGWTCPRTVDCGNTSPPVVSVPLGQKLCTKYVTTKLLVCQSTTANNAVSCELHVEVPPNPCGTSYYCIVDTDAPCPLNSVEGVWSLGGQTGDDLQSCTIKYE
jgi:hypothetical protein